MTTDDKIEFGTQERVESGNLVIDGMPEIPPRIKQRLAQYQNTRSAALHGWLQSGGVLITTRFAETDQVHIVERPGGARRQITFFDEPVGSAAVCPDPGVDGFLFTRDAGGSEFYQIFFFDLATGDCRLLTDGVSQNMGIRWSNDGDRFAYSTTRRNGRDYDVHVADVSGPESSTPVLETEGLWTVEDWSPDDTKLLLRRYVSINECYLYITDLAGAELVEIDAADEKIARSDARFGPDGRSVILASDRDREFRMLRHHDLDTGEQRVLTDHIPWDVGGIAISADRRRVAFVSNEDGIFRPHVMDSTTFEELPVPELPMGLVVRLRFSPDGSRLGATLNGPQTVGDIYSMDLDSGELVRWTYGETGGLNVGGFVVPELIRYSTFDLVEGAPRQIPAFYYRPQGEGPFPVLVQIHGGPEGQSHPRFSPGVAYYVNELGIAVLLPNVRGSSGYGKTYLLLDNGYRREDSVRDIGGLIDWIREQPELDAGRVAVYGGSYGGYMVLACMMHYSDRLRAGVELVGVSNFVTFLENTQDYRRDLRRAEYGDERDPEMREFLDSIAPANHADRIRKPLLVGQGLNDPRVPVSESEQMVDVIRENGGTVAYVLAKDEGHGFRKKVNRDYFQAATALFLEHYLR